MFALLSTTNNNSEKEKEYLHIVFLLMQLSQFARTSDLPSIEKTFINTFLGTIMGFTNCVGSIPGFVAPKVPFIFLTIFYKPEGQHKRIMCVCTSLFFFLETKKPVTQKMYMMNHVR